MDPEVGLGHGGLRQHTLATHPMIEQLVGFILDTHQRKSDCDHP